MGRIAAVVLLTLLVAAGAGAITPAGTALIYPHRDATAAPTPLLKVQMPRWMCHRTPRGFMRWVPGQGWVRCQLHPATRSPYYYIVHHTTKMVAEVFAHKMENGAAVALWANYGGTSEQFTIKLLQSQPFTMEPDELWFLVQARHSGKCLRTNGYQSGAPVVQAECGGEAAQMWRMRTRAKTLAECGNPNQCFPDERQVIENAYALNIHRQRCLDSANGKFPSPPQQGAALIAIDCIPNYSAPNAVNQDWELANIDDGQPPSDVYTGP